MEHWNLVRDERLALAERLEPLSPADWATPSLCGKWTVKDVAAHVMVGPTASLVDFGKAMVLARGSFDGANERLVAARRRLSPAELVALIRDNAGSRFSPPTMDWHAPLTDLLVHRHDIGIPLGWPSDRPAESWRHALGFLVTSKARSGFVSGKLPALRYVATDVDWTHDEGPEVSGPASALGLALTRRTPRLDELTGPGAAILQAWAGE